MIKLRHHYWDVRGRAQVLRYMLEQIAYQHKDVEYREEFEPIETAFTTWSQRKCDPTVSGPYRVLPVLHWNEKDTFGETLAIGSNISFCFSSSKLNFRLFSAHLLARKFDFYGKPTSNYSDSILLESYLNGVASSAYTDVIANILMCIWHSTTFELENNPQAYTVQRIRDTLDAFNVLLKQSSTSFCICPKSTRKVKKINDQYDCELEPTDFCFSNEQTIGKCPTGLFLSLIRIISNRLFSLFRNSL